MKIKVKIAQKAAWNNDNTGYESIPLAAGYLKSMAYDNQYIKSNIDIDICNFNGSAETISIIRDMFAEQHVEIACFSMFGWNYNQFANVADTFKQLNPKGWVIFGGTHVTNQATKVFKKYPAVDIIINGEGELTFCEVLLAYLNNKSISELSYIKGISFRNEDREIVTTEPRERIKNLDIIPSPFLTGAIDLTNEEGKFKYDVALIETNRGCPYKCGYCFWGGATGQKIYNFSIERLRAEIELFAKLKVNDICLCDSNFGLTEHDEQFFDILLEAREKYGYPKCIITSWAKNKTQIFSRILKKVKDSRFMTSFSISLQSLSEDVLKNMGRVNMKRDDWKKVAKDLRKDGLDVYGELIWGLPGETPDSFFKGYDIMSEEVTRIAVYPHLLIPNTKYSMNKNQYGIVGWKAGKDDFEYVLKHNTMTFEENCKMHRFIFWARLLAEYSLLRHIWIPIRKIANITQSQVLLNFDNWIDQQSDDTCKMLREYRDEVVKSLDAYRIEDELNYFFKTKKVKEIVNKWWNEEIIKKVPNKYKDFFKELMIYDLLTMPIYGTGTMKISDKSDIQYLDGYPLKKVGNDNYYMLQDVKFEYDIPELEKEINFGEIPEKIEKNIYTTTLYYKVGFSDYIANHEFYNQFVGMFENNIKEHSKELALV
ncbi:KedN5 family methylcobalamin-dependent radical SAM C-methyltransferase [Clostridium akagii]|uniref:KedN5 family methylcobalamin-dependent radical SAM C-methyltransferase n=1 Tax=Clostridium akagii TaxID=91623 RepID=UPI00069155EE|nr:KedN5 family methylcobalamin-dependent radical SAM C-methyltransferase [Clostridium akagii]